jgi:hypothetical protein
MLLTWTSLIRQALSRQLWPVSRPSRWPRPKVSRRRFDVSPFHIGAEVLEIRQLLTSISAVSPSMAGTAGGTNVSVVGSGFTNVTGVMFGSTPATSWQVNSSSALTAVSPQHTAGAVDIQVITSGGSSPIDPTHDQFTYVQSGPSVTGVSPSSGGLAGGQTITVTGSNFNSVSAVMFGNAFATSFTVTSPTSLTAVSPQHTAGAVDIIVTTSAGSSSVDPTHDQFTYSNGGPTITGVSPSTGTGSGGTSVTIAGTGFSGVTAITFGGTNATSYVVNSATSISAVSPGHTAGTVDIVVTAASGASPTGSGDQFVYTAPTSTPSVTGLGTTSGPAAGGTSVVVMGTNFNSVSAVMFGSVAARSFTVNSPTSITAISDAESAGTVDVTVTNSAGTSATSAADRFTFQSPAPVITGLDKTSGTTAGGTSITISGSNFFGASAVSFGGVPGASFVLNSPTSITAVSPAHSVGLVDITVTTPDGTSAVSSSDQYTFATPGVPVVTNLSASTGPTGGGTTITITGTNFTNVTGVSFGTVAATYFTISSDTSIIAVSPAESAGTIDVTVTSNVGTSPTSSADQFTFSSSATNPTGPAVSVIGLSTPVPPGGSAAPVVAGLPTVPPTANWLAAGGPSTGGTPVTIFGTGFLNSTGVSFGSVAATSFTILSDGAILATSPPSQGGAQGGSSAVDVTVQAGSTTSAVSAADQYVYTAPGNVPMITGLDKFSGSAAGGDVVTISGANLGTVTAVQFVIPASAGNPAQSISATQFLVDSDSSILVVAPAYVGVPPSGGAVADITVTSAAGTSATSAADQFTYFAAATSGSSATAGPAAPSTTPTITGLSATSGSSAGGDRLTITGTNLTGVQSVTFVVGQVSQPATFVVSNADGSLTVTTPAFVGVPPSGGATADIVIKTLSGTSPLTASDHFTFLAPPSPPTVSGLAIVVAGAAVSGAPHAGSTTGGTVVNITGTNFSQVTGVQFVVPPSGGSTGQSVPAAAFTVVSPTLIQAVVPGQGAGAVDVTVTTPTVLKRLPVASRSAGRVGTGRGLRGAVESDYRLSTRILPFATAA